MLDGETFSLAVSPVVLVAQGSFDDLGLGADMDRVEGPEERDQDYHGDRHQDEIGRAAGTGRQGNSCDLGLGVLPRVELRQASVWLRGLFFGGRCDVEPDGGRREGLHPRHGFGSVVMERVHGPREQHQKHGNQRDREKGHVAGTGRQGNSYEEQM